MQGQYIKEKEIKYILMEFMMTQDFKYCTVLYLSWERKKPKWAIYIIMQLYIKGYTLY